MKPFQFPEVKRPETVFAEDVTFQQTSRSVSVALFYNGTIRLALSKRIFRIDYGNINTD